MKKVLLVVLFLLFCSNSNALELVPGVNIDQLNLTINKEGVMLRHDGKRDIFTLSFENKSVTVIDIDCDGSVDIVFVGGKAVPKTDSFFSRLESFLRDWKCDVDYDAWVNAWQEWKKGRR
ncbi:MAG: hypothetical protein V1645_01515 [archaeon]